MQITLSFIIYFFFKYKVCFISDIGRWQFNICHQTFEQKSHWKLLFKIQLQGGHTLRVLWYRNIGNLSLQINIIKGKIYGHSSWNVPPHSFLAHSIPCYLFFYTYSYPSFSLSIFSQFEDHRIPLCSFLFIQYLLNALNKVLLKFMAI